LPKSTISRRGFAKNAVGVALAAVAQPSSVARDSGTSDSSDQQSDEADLTLAQIQEVDARFNETMRRYGDRLSEKQRRHIRRILVQNQRMLAPIRDFALANGDEPATTLKIRVEKSPAGGPLRENDATRTATHAQ
jgi:uncharacterized protein YecT (DUF1311 family)